MKPKKNNYPGYIVLALFLVTAFITQAQNPTLDSYIAQGLQSNQALKQRQLDYAAQLSSLKEAKGLFFPGVSLNARYSVARGGRQIEFPVGDLLNPVYGTLNMLTASNLFPQIENESFAFYRPKEHETKLSLVQPLYNSELVQNYRIKQNHVEIARIDVVRYQRELIREITQAYFDYLKALNLVSLADTSISLVRENLRVSQRLFDNDKVTKDAVYRSESELSKVEVQQAQANNMLQASAAYFNFLLNRPLDSQIESSDEVPLAPTISLENASLLAIQNRDELRQIEQFQQLNLHATKLQRGKNYPGLFGVVDYGFQGEQYRFTQDDDFLLASLVMKWNIFQGNSNHQKVLRSKIEGEKLSELYSETQQQIRLEVIHHFYALHAAYESVQSAGKQSQSANRAYKLINRKFAEGQASLLELIDARTSMTNAATNLIISESEYFIRLADFEYAMGSNGPENY